MIYWQSLIQLTCTVMRDGKTAEIPSASIVSGEIPLFHAGDMVPADCIILTSNELHVNEASLTGESYPVRKFPGSVSATTVLAARTNCLWQGTNVVIGNRTAIVTETGKNTFFSNITKSATESVVLPAFLESVKGKFKEI